MRKDLNNKEELEFYTYVQSLVNCNIETGEFTWKVREVNSRSDKTWNTKHSGKQCGGISKDGYRSLSVTYNGRLLTVFLHKLFWFIIHGALPKVQIDHINQVRTDNRLVNLREVTSAENNRNRKITSNNASGVLGVQWDKQRRRWVGLVTVDGIRYRLGSYKDIDDAEIAVKSFRKEKGFTELHGSK